MNKEWNKVEALGPGVHNFRGKKTLVYNGEKLYDEDSDEYLIYNEEERQRWEVIIVLPGVKVIPEWTFKYCEVTKVIMADTVKRIEHDAFYNCESLVYIKLSKHLEFIGLCAFCCCRLLTSIFIPPSCKEVEDKAFVGCHKLIIFYVPQETELGHHVIAATELIKASSFELNKYGWIYYYKDRLECNKWIKNINQAGEYALHRECTSFDPSENAIYEILKRQGLASFHLENEIGITASRYLQENPFTQIKEQKLINRYVLDLMGEIST